MPLDPKLLSTYLAMIQAKKLRDAQAQTDATKVNTPTPPSNLKLSSGLAAAMAMSRFKQTQQPTPAAPVDTVAPIPPHPNILKDADKDVMIKVIKAAKKHGVDPYTAVAIGLQETGLVKDRFKQLGLASQYKPGYTQFIPNENPLHLNKQAGGDMTEDSIIFLKEKLKYGKSLGKKTDEELIQAYNGYGKFSGDVDYTTFRPEYLDMEKKLGRTLTDSEVRKLEYKHRTMPQKMYGLTATREKPIDMGKDYVYGKRIKQIMNMVNANPELVKLINSIQ